MHTEEGSRLRTVHPMAPFSRSTSPKWIAKVRNRQGCCQRTSHPCSLEPLSRNDVSLSTLGAFAGARFTIMCRARPTARRKCVVRDPERRFPDRSGSHSQTVLLERRHRRPLHVYARSLNSDVGLSFSSSIAVHEFSHGFGC